MALIRLLLLALLSLPAAAQDRFITVASTTSTEQSGLFGFMLPAFKKDTGIDVRVVALGTGQALDMARRGDADVAFVHDRAAEDKFVAEGSGINRKDVMYNDFVIVGPKSDPAKVAGGKDAAAALKKIARCQGAVRVARRQERHACRGTAAVEVGRRRSRCRERTVVSRHRFGHGPGAQHRVERRTPTS